MAADIDLVQWVGIEVWAVSVEFGMIAEAVTLGERGVTCQVGCEQRLLEYLFVVVT